MEKYLVTIEFRYEDEYVQHLSNKITVGIYDDFNEACINGNKLLENLESKFEIHVFPNGKEAKRERFSSNGGCFGSKKDLITNLAYLKTPFEFYAKIITLKFADINEIVDGVVNSVNRYKDYKQKICRLNDG